MSYTLDRFINPSFTYKFWQGPREVRTEADALQKGLNCVALAHLSLKALFDYTLPPTEHCYEMYTDKDRFTDVIHDGAVQRGDLLWYGPARPDSNRQPFTPHYDDNHNLLNWRESPVKHIAVATGETIGGDPIMLHATHIEGTNTLWPAAQFAHYQRYEHVFRVARLATGNVAVQ